MSSWRQAVLATVAVPLTHASVVLGLWCWLDGRTLTVVSLSVPDLLLGPEEPPVAGATAFDAVTGATLEGVGLRFAWAGEAGGAGEQIAVTDEVGRAKSAMKGFPAEGEAPAEARLAVSIVSPPGLLLAALPAASPWGRRQITAEGLVLRPQTDFLLVDLGRLDKPAFQLSSSFVERLGDEAQSHSRTLYLATISEPRRELVRREIERQALPEGLLVLLDPNLPPPARLAGLAERLSAVEAAVKAILCEAEAEAIYAQVFPGTRILSGLR
jgi:hypothetical protein